MKKNKPFLIGCVVFPVVLVICFMIGFFSSMMSDKGLIPKSIPDNAWLRINISGVVADYNEMEPVKWLNSETNSADELVAKIHSASTDSRIKGILLEPGVMQIGYPSLNEIGLALTAFKKTGKPVVAHAEYFSQGAYLLTSHANDIYMEPSASAGLILEGVSTNLMFYKELFDKLGIKMHIMQSGEFKGAGEPYSQTSLSNGTRDNIDAVLKDRYSILLRDIAARRKLNIEDVRKIFETREDYFLSAKAAKDLKLIDFPMSRMDMLEKLKLDSDNLVNIADYTAQGLKQAEDKVAVVYLSGQISPQVSNDFNTSTISSAKVKKIIEDIKDDKSIKAVVLRINSPGGSALESEKIYQQLMKLRKDMPIVISMGSVAASGGYYISCASDYIMADETTITGSIGVIMMIPETEGLGKKLGLRTQTLKHGKFAGAFNQFQAYDPILLASLKRSSTATYDEFKARVITARKYEPGTIDSVAEGRVFSAAKAKQLRLIDEIGNLDAAIAKAASMVNLKSYSSVSLPTKTSLFEALKNSDFMNLRQSLRINTDPAALLERNLRQIPATGEWQYLLPNKLD